MAGVADALNGMIEGLTNGGGKAGNEMASTEAKIDTTNGLLEGIHSSNNQLIQAFSELPPLLQEQAKYLSNMVDGLGALKTVVESQSPNATVKKVNEGMKNKKTPDESDVAKLPDIYGMPGLLLHQDLKDILNKLGELVPTGATEKEENKTEGKEIPQILEQLHESLDGINNQINLISNSMSVFVEQLNNSLELMSSQLDWIGQRIPESIIVENGKGEENPEIPILMEQLRLSLEHISGQLDWIGQRIPESEKTPKIKKDDKDEAKEKKKGAGLAGVLSGLLGGVSNLAQLAGALILFAGAALILSVLNWGAALIGLAMFAAFVTGAVYLATKLAADPKNAKNLNEFGNLAMKMSMALGLFGIALGVLSLVVLLVGPAIFGTLIILAFFLGFMAVAMLITKLGGPAIKHFGDMAIKLSLALLIFAGTIVILKLISPLVLAAIPDVLIIMGLFFIFIALGAIISKFSGDLKQFAIGSILLSVSLVIFSFALLVLKFVALELARDAQLFKVGDTTFDVPTGVILIMGLFLVFIAIGVIISKFAGNLVMFALGSILLTVALVVFSLGLIVLSWVYKKLMAEGGPMVGFGEYLVPFSVILILGLFLVFIAVGAICSAAAGSLILFAIGSILLAVALVAFAFALQMLIDLDLVNNGENLLYALGVIALVIAAAAIIGLACVAAIIGIGLFSAAALLLSVALIVFSVALNEVMKLDLVENKELVLGSLDVIAEIIMKAAGLGAKSALAMIGLVPFTAACLLLGVSLLPFTLVLQGLIDIRKKMIEEKVTTEEVLKPIELLLQAVGNLAQNMKGVSLEAAAAFAIIMDATLGSVETILGMMDALIDVAKSGKVEEAKPAFQDIIQHFFGIDPTTGQFSGDPLTLLGLLDSISKMGVELSEGQARAIAALVPLTESLDTITNMISKLEGVDVEAGVTAIGSMIPLMENLVGFADYMGGQSGDGGGFFGKIAGKLTGTLEDKFKAATKMLQVGGPMDEMMQAINGLIDVISPIQAKVETVTASTALQDFGKLFAEDIVKPMENLDKATTNIQNFETSIRKLSGTLKDFVSNNKNVLKETGGILSGAASLAQKAGDALSKMGGAKGSDKGSSTEKSPMEQIQEDVKAIRDKVAGPEKDFRRG
jgi:hypothetical protein